MMRQRSLNFAPVLVSFALLALAMLPAGCDRRTDAPIQGYVEGEYVSVASPVAGQLSVLSVSRGQQVKKSDLLFELDATFEKAALGQAQWRLMQSRATLDDLRKGMRPTEITELEAQLKQARAALVYAEAEATRLENLLPTGGSSRHETDQATTIRDQDRWKVAQLEAQLETAKLGSRSDQIAAAEADVKAREAAVASAAEFILEGLHVHNKLNKSAKPGGISYRR